MKLMVRLSLMTRLPLSELLTWEPEAISEALLWLEEQAKEARDASKGR